MEPRLIFIDVNNSSLRRGSPFIMGVVIKWYEIDWNIDNRRFYKLQKPFDTFLSHDVAFWME